MQYLLSLAVAGLLALSGAEAAHAGVDSGIVGLWYYKTNFAMVSAASLTLRYRGNRWTAILGNETARARQGPNSLQFSFAGGDSLRVYLSGNQPKRVFWVRRAVLSDPEYPAGASQSYAGPVALRLTANDTWSGEIVPLADPYTVYLSIFRDASGTLVAAFRNPERNEHGPAMQFDLTRNGNELTFSPVSGSGKPLIATLSGTTQRIYVTWPYFSKVIPFSRATSQETALFYARNWPVAVYRYREPEDMHDGWKPASAATLGVDEAALEKVVQGIAEMDPSASRIWPIHSITVAYRGRLILDEYFYGQNALDTHDMRSASKTFANVLIGGLLESGTGLPIDANVYDVLKDLGPFANPDPRKDRVTLEHILTHTSGLACDDNNDSSPGNEDAMQSQLAQPNWWKYTLDLPMAYEPGTHYAYCSANINLVGAVLTTRTHEWLPELFDRLVAQPLQFGQYYWNVMPNGEGYLGGGAYVRPRDFLKIGQTYLDGGTWNGLRLVPAEWVKTSLAAHARISPETTGLRGDAFTENYYDTDEGLAWHILPVRSGSQRYAGYFANGNGGQLLVLVPQFDLAVMFTAGAYQTGFWNRERDDIVGDMIIPALPRLDSPPKTAP